MVGMPGFEPGTPRLDYMMAEPRPTADSLGLFFRPVADRGFVLPPLPAFVAIGCKACCASNFCIASCSDDDVVDK
jgi:hypothetical protein